MEDGLLGRANALEQAQNLLVRVAVMDLHCDAVLFGQSDVRLERPVLSRLTLGIRAEEVKPRLADRPHPRVGGKLIDRRDRLIEASRRLVGRCLVRVDRHRCENLRVMLRGPHRPPRRLHVTGCLHHTRDPRRGRAGELLRQAQRVVAVHDLEVTVVVVHRNSQRLRQRGVGEVTPTRCRPLPHVGARVAHAGCSTRGNSGAKPLTEVPGFS